MAQPFDPFVHIADPGATGPAGINQHSIDGCLTLCEQNRAAQPF